jgi:hypothetical protein
MNHRVLEIHRGDAEARRLDELTRRVISASLEVVNWFPESSAPPRLGGSIYV